MAKQRGQYELYSRMAVRWVARYIAECNPSIEDLRMAVCGLGGLGYYRFSYSGHQCSSRLISSITSAYCCCNCGVGSAYT